MMPSHPSQQGADGVFQQHATIKLRDALRLPATSPSVAHWLFSDRHSPFHRDFPLLPPTAFTNALAIVVNDLFTHFLPFTNPFAMPFPTETYFGSASGKPPPPELTSEAMVQLLFIPAKVDTHVVYGYSFSVMTTHDERFIPFDTENPEPQMKGRFIFDRDKKQLLCVLPTLGPSTMGIISMQSLHNNRRLRTFFTVENRQYSFDNLPDRVLALVRNIEYKVENASVMQFGKPGEDCVDLTSGVQAPVDDMERWATGLMQSANHARLSGESSSLQLYLGKDASTTDPFNMDTISESLAELEGVISGKYFAPRLNRDTMHPVTGEITARMSGELRASFEAVGPVELQMMREIAAQMYYATSMAISADNVLSVRKHPLLLQNSCEEHGEKRARVGETMLAPKPELNCVHCHQGVAFPAPAVVNEEELKEMKKEAKRRKNRLSAARSNQRRKERVQAQQKELEELKEKLEVLKGVEERLKNENQLLKSQAGG